MTQVQKFFYKWYTALVPSLLIGIGSLLVYIYISNLEYQERQNEKFDTIIKELQVTNSAVSTKIEVSTLKINENTKDIAENKNEIKTIKSKIKY